MTWQLKPATAHAANGEAKADFRVVCDSAEDLLRATADLGGEKVAAVRARVDHSLKALRTRMSEAQEAVVDRARADARAADAYVHENPWKSVGAGMVAGLVIGLLVARR